MTAPLIKICGLTRKQDAALCEELGVDFTGFIFAPGSPRRISPAAAAALPTGRAARVGVFAGQSLEEVLACMNEAGLDFAQLHSGESPDFCRAVGADRVVKTLWPLALAGQPTMRDALHDACAPFADACAYFLLDAGGGGGGSGMEIPREGLGGFCPPRPWLLAGGIGPGNVAQALQECAPAGIDCNSAVEAAPGVKDEGLLRALVHATRQSRN